MAVRSLPKLAKLFDLKIGSTFTVQNSDNDPFEIRVAGIMENYAMHYVYMTPLYYEEIFDAGPEVNSQLLTYDNHDHNPEWEDQLGESLTASQRVAMVSFTSGVSDAFSDTMDSMNVVVVVLIVSRGPCVCRAVQSDEHKRIRADTGAVNDQGAWLL